MKNLNPFKLFSWVFVVQAFIISILSWFIYSKRIWNEPTVYIPYLIFIIVVVFISIVFSYVYKPRSKRFTVYFVAIILVALFVLMSNISVLRYGEDFLALLCIIFSITFLGMLGINRPMIGALYGMLLVFIIFGLGVIAGTAAPIVIILYGLIVYAVSFFVGKKINRQIEV